MKFAITPKHIIAWVFLISASLALMLKIQMDDTRNHFVRFHTHRKFTGDEVYYLRMVQTLATDGNLELSNLWDLSDIWKKPGYEEQIPEGVRPADQLLKYGLNFTGKNGGTYCLHLPGMSALLLPTYIMDSKLHPNNPAKDPPRLPLLPQKLYLTRILLALIGVSILFLLYRLLSGLFDSIFVVMALILLLIFNSPFSGYIFQVVPELWATFFLLIGLNVLLRPLKKAWVNIFMMVVSIGCLPWLHQRHAALALGLFMAYILFRHKEEDFFKQTLVLVLCLLIIGCIYLHYFYAISGDPSPLAPSRLHGRAYSSLANLPLGFFGNFFHPVAGCIWHYPWTVLFFFGIYWGFKKDPLLTLTILLVFLPYFLMASTSVTWGGATWPRNRYMVALYPIFLLFSGFTLRNLFQEFSYSKLIYYLGLFSFIFLNRKFWFMYFPFSDNFKKPSIIHTDVIWMIKSAVILMALYLSLYIADTLLFKGRKELKIL